MKEEKKYSEKDQITSAKIFFFHISIGVLMLKKFFLLVQDKKILNFREKKKYFTPFLYFCNIFLSLKVIHRSSLKMWMQSKYIVFTINSKFIWMHSQFTVDNFYCKIYAFKMCFFFVYIVFIKSEDSLYRRKKTGECIKKNKEKLLVW